MLPEGTGEPELSASLGWEGDPFPVRWDHLLPEVWIPVQPLAKARGMMSSHQSIHRELQGVHPCRSFLLLLRAMESSSSIEGRWPELVPLLGQWAAQLHLQQTSALPPAHITGNGAVYKY